jgi:hypothetical protein
MNELMDGKLNRSPQICKHLDLKRRCLICENEALQEKLNKLVAAASKVTCKKCWGHGVLVGIHEHPARPCPDCSDLRGLLHSRGVKGPE